MPGPQRSHCGRGSLPRDLLSSLHWVSCLRKKSCVLSRLLLEPKHTQHNPSRAAMLDWAGGPGTYLPLDHSFLSLPFLCPSSSGRVC